MSGVTGKGLEKTSASQVRILIVEDDQDLREALSIALRDEGYAVSSARDSDEAIQKVKANKFTIIFMDILLPGINGVETHKAIKKIAPSAKTVMMTGYFLPSLVEEAISNQAYGVLYKPFTMDDILTVIKKITG